MTMKPQIMVMGCCGKMGLTLCHHLLTHKDYQLAAAVDTENIGKDIGTQAGLKTAIVQITNNLSETISKNKIDIAIDFTQPNTVVENASICLSNGIATIIGTTGITQEGLKQLETLALAHKTAALIVPNFAIGAILMMEFAKKAAKYMPKVEIIEQHHDQKLDMPSGTALKTRTEILNSLGKSKEGSLDLVPIHSVRLPGLVAHQEVIFGSLGQTLTIRHDSLNRESFMPGIDLALEQIKTIKGLEIGLKV